MATFLVEVLTRTDPGDMCPGRQSLPDVRIALLHARSLGVQGRGAQSMGVRGGRHQGRGPSDRAARIPVPGEGRSAERVHDGRDQTGSSTNTSRSWAALEIPAGTGRARRAVPTSSPAATSSSMFARNARPRTRAVTAGVGVGRIARARARARDFGRGSNVLGPGGRAPPRAAVHGGGRRLAPRACARSLPGAGALSVGRRRAICSERRLRGCARRCPAAGWCRPARGCRRRTGKRRCRRRR